MKKLSVVMAFFFVIGFFIAPAAVFADDIFETGAHVTQADVDKFYMYEKLMRIYMLEENTNNISDERYKEIIQQAGFASEKYFGYMIYRIESLRSYLMYEYDLQEAKDARRLMEELFGETLAVSNPAMAQMTLERMGSPEPTAEEIKLILNNWDKLPRAIYLKD